MKSNLISLVNYATMNGLGDQRKLVSMIIKNHHKVSDVTSVSDCYACGCRITTYDVFTEICTISLCEDCKNPYSVHLYKIDMDEQYVKEEYPRVLIDNLHRNDQCLLRYIISGQLVKSHGYAPCECCFHYREHKKCISTYNGVPICMICVERGERMLYELVTKSMNVALVGFSNITDINTAIHNTFVCLHLGLAC